MIAPLSRSRIARAVRVSSDGVPSAGLRKLATRVFALGSLAALSLTSGCSSAKPATAQAAIASELGAGTAMGSTAMCPLGIGMSWISIGSDTDNPISNGSKYDGAPVKVICTVHPSGGNFTVSLNGTVEGQGSIGLSGTIASDTTQVNTGITGNFTSATISGLYTENDCTFDFGGQSSDINPEGAPGNPFGIAAGRIWGNINCPMIANSENGNICVAEAEMRFENCSE